MQYAQVTKILVKKINVFPDVHHGLWISCRKYGIAVGRKYENSGCYSNEYIVRTGYIFIIAPIKEPIKEEFKIVSDLILSFLREVILISMLEMAIHEML